MGAPQWWVRDFASYLALFHKAIWLLARSCCQVVKYECYIIVIVFFELGWPPWLTMTLLYSYKDRQVMKKKKGTTLKLLQAPTAADIIKMSPVEIGIPCYTCVILPIWRFQKRVDHHTCAWEFRQLAATNVRSRRRYRGEPNKQVCCRLIMGRFGVSLAV